MTNDKNLIPLNELCKEDAKKIQSKGGKARAQKIKEQKQYEAFQISASNILCKIQVNTLDNLGKLIEKLSNKENLNPREIKTIVEVLQFLRDSSGQKPIDKQEISNTNMRPQIIVDNEKTKQAIEQLFNDAEKENRRENG